MAKQSATSHWGPVAISAAVLAIASLGDSLLYVVLPISAAAFGVNLVWVGILLAANRIIRIFLYGGVAALGEWVGARQLGIVAANAAAVSTLMLWAFSGGPQLLVARVLWGLAFAGLSLSALAYAVKDKSRAGSSIGISRAIHQLGPVASLSVGAWLVSIVGPRDVFLLLGSVSLIAIPLAIRLPKPTTQPVRKPTKWLPRPRRFDLFFFIVGFAVDGVFAMAVALMLAKTMSAESAILAAGLILASRRLGEIVFAPPAGWLSDRFGRTIVLVIAAVTLAMGFALLAATLVYIGSALVILGRAAIAAVGPALIAEMAEDDERLHRLAVMQTWRDFGAAVGPIVAGVSAQTLDPAFVNLGLAVCVLLSLGTLIGMRSHSNIGS